MLGPSDWLSIGVLLRTATRQNQNNAVRLRRLACVAAAERVRTVTEQRDSCEDFSRWSRSSDLNGMCFYKNAAGNLWRLSRALSTGKSIWNYISLLTSDYYIDSSKRHTQTRTHAQTCTSVRVLCTAEHFSKYNSKYQEAHLSLCVALPEVYQAGRPSCTILTVKMVRFNCDISSRN